MTTMKRFFCVFALLCMLGCFAPGLNAADKPKKEGAKKKAAKVERPWMILMGRPAVGAATINAVTLYWQTESGLRGDVNEMESVFQGTITPEAFFMPTKKRGLILSASLPVGFGTGRMKSSGILDDETRPVEGKAELAAGDEIFKAGDASFYNYVLVTGGIGYQFYLGKKDRSAIYLLSHFGGGPAWFNAESLGSTAKAGPMTGIDVDGSVGFYHRLKNRVVLGASLDGWLLFFRGDFTGPIDFPVDIILGGVGLNGMAGYAFY